MAHWKSFRGWMAFDRLDEGVGLTRAFTIGYRFTDDRADPWTRRFNRFKEKNRTALLGGAAVMSDAVPRLVSGLRLDPASTVFVPALSSRETIASDAGVLWRLARLCARAAQVQFVGDAVTKKVHEPLHMYRNVGRRHEILSGADFRSKKIAADSILIFDDFITRGATLSHIAQAMQESNQQAKIYGVALAKTDRRSFWQSRGLEISNDHVPEQWDSMWREGIESERR